MAKLNSCRVAGCENMSGVSGSADGLCRAHYKRRRRWGSELEPHHKIVSWRGEKCAEGGCDKPIMAHGLCDNHDQKARRRQNPEAQRLRNAAFKERYRAKQEAEMGRPRPIFCELCGDSGYGRGSKPNAGICFDHDHVTGAPRGWLCDRCNKVLGLVKDSPDLLKGMAHYLEAHSGKIDLKRA